MEEHAAENPSAMTFCAFRRGLVSNAGKPYARPWPGRGPWEANKIQPHIRRYLQGIAALRPVGILTRFGELAFFFLALRAKTVVYRTQQRCASSCQQLRTTSPETAVNRTREAGDTLVRTRP
jgi:hypothetical protein